MKQGIHPKYEEATVHCSCGNSFTTRSTKSEIHVELCSQCHPFYTGKQKFVDTGGRVQRFADRYGNAAQAVMEKEAAEKEARIKAAEEAAASAAAAKAERDAEAAKAAERAERAAARKSAEAEAVAEEAPVAEAEAVAEEAAAEETAE